MELINALGINAKLLIVQAVGFLILLFILKKFLFSRILAVIRARTEEVRGTLEKTEMDRDTAERLRIAYENRLADAKEEANRKIQDAVKEANNIADGIVKKAHDEVIEIKSKARTDIELSRKMALVDVRNQVVSLTLLASSRLIEQSISEDTARRLVNNVINEVGGLS